MMSFDIWILYVLTVLAIIIVPGSSQVLMLSNSVSYGFRSSLFTALGDLSANMLQMLAASLGLGVLIMSSDFALTIIKWTGVTYLIWHAIRMIKHSKPLLFESDKDSLRSPIKMLYLQGFITSSSNPKAILFFAALFPQFISYESNFWFQFSILSSTFILIDGLFLLVYGFGAQWMLSFLKPRSTIWVNRVAGVFILFAAALLGFKSIDDVVK